MKATHVVSIAIAVSTATACNPPSVQQDSSMPEYASIGHIERLSPDLDVIVDPDDTPEILASGFQWSEGPVWIAEADFLLFSDVPANKMYRWSEGDTVASVFLDPSGLSQTEPWAGSGGSNGLTLDSSDRLVMAQHGDRRVARLDQKPAQLRDQAGASMTTIAERFDDKRLNSPNDVVFGPNGDLYFTDPPYGIGDDSSDLREQNHNGVYRVSRDGEVHLLDAKLSRPNGIGFSPDGSTMYVSNSDPEHAVWIAYDVQDDGSVSNRRVFFDATAWTSSKPGLPDGLKVDRLGNVFGTGPGGVLVFAPDGRHLGTIATGGAIANCAFGNDGKTLYMTAHNHLVRIRVLTGR